MNNNCNSAIETTKQGMGLHMSQIMSKAVHFASKGALTAKVVDDILENGLKKIENMLRGINIHESSASKEIEVDSRDDDPASEANPTVVLDPPRVRTKGVTNARLKSQLEKKMKKRKKRVQPICEIRNVEKAKNQKLANIEMAKSKKLKGAIGADAELPRKSKTSSSIPIPTGSSHNISIQAKLVPQRANMLRSNAAFSWTTGFDFMPPLGSSLYNTSGPLSQGFQRETEEISSESMLQVQDNETTMTEQQQMKVFFPIEELSFF